MQLGKNISTSFLRWFFFRFAAVSFGLGVATIASPPNDPRYSWLPFVFAPMLFGPSVVWFVAFQRLRSRIFEPTLRGAWLLAMVYLSFLLGLVPEPPWLPILWLFLGVPLAQVFYHRHIKVVCGETTKPDTV